MPTIPLIRLHEIFPASFEAVDSFCAKVRPLIADNAIERDRFAVELLLREALTNAVKHGANTNAALSVECDFSLESGCAVMTVTDPGIGFDRGKAFSVEVNENDQSGRGLWIIVSYASSIVFNEQGNRVVITRRLAPILRDSSAVSRSSAMENTGV